MLVAVKAGALDYLDVWTRRGLPGVDLELPPVPGSDAAGVVSEADDVLELVRGGTVRTPGARDAPDERGRPVARAAGEP